MLNSKRPTLRFFEYFLCALQVYDFFKERIENLYPLDPSPEDPLQVQREAHEVS